MFSGRRWKCGWRGDFGAVFSLGCAEKARPARIMEKAHKAAAASSATEAPKQKQHASQVRVSFGYGALVGFPEGTGRPQRKTIAVCRCFDELKLQGKPLELPDSTPVFYEPVDTE